MGMPLIDISGQERELMVGMLSERIGSLARSREEAIPSVRYGIDSDLRILTDLREKLAGLPVVVVRDESGVSDGEAV